MRLPIAALALAMTMTMAGKASSDNANLNFHWRLAGLQGASQELPHPGWAINNSITALPDGVVGQTYSYNLNNLLVPSGTVGNWTATGLPNGLTLDTSTGTLNGIVNEASAANVTLSVLVNGTGSGVTLPIQFEAEEVIAWSLDNTPDGSILPKAVFDLPYEYSLLNKVSPSGLSGLTWSASGLPSWASLDHNTGSITGTPNHSHKGETDFAVTAALGDEVKQSVYTIIVGGLSLNVKQISSGENHVCAITTDDAAYCWGANTKGQLGDGTTLTRGVPKPVTGISEPVSSISAGTEHTCAVTQSGKAYCWGLNTVGQLGDGTTSQKTLPAQVSTSTGIGEIKNISASNYHTCATSRSGAAYCWGSSTAGRLGNGAVSGVHPRPVAVDNMSSGVSNIVTGDAHTCAIKDSDAYCWGNNTWGGLGNGDTTRSSTPVKVLNLPSVKEITAGTLHSCAITISGAVHCWGYNNRGQLGNNTATSSSIPVATSGLASGVSSITGGNAHTCAIRDGAALCWGYGGFNQLGTGSTDGAMTPQPVLKLTDGVAGISAGHRYTCATHLNGSGYCWGSNAGNQIHDGSATSESEPYEIMLE